MYVRFQESYYGTILQTFLSRERFKAYVPIVVIDYPKQKEPLKLAPVNIRLDIEVASLFP